MKKEYIEYPDLQAYDDRWTMQDQTELEFLRMKYANMPGVTEDTNPEWMELRKIADKNKFLDDGVTKNPHYPRLKIEADMARLQYELGYMVRVNAILFQQMQMQGMVFERIGLLEGAYSYLRSALDGVKAMYQDSVKKHFEERREWHTQNAMRRAGLDPAKKEDRLRWAHKLDEITAKVFAVEKKLAGDDGIDYAQSTTTKEEQHNEVIKGSPGADGKAGEVLPREDK